MICITNGVQTLVVTNGAYECIYRDAGFRPLGSSPAVSETGVDTYPPISEMPHLEDSTQENEDSTGEGEDSDDDEVEDEPVDYSEIPLSELGFEELCDYADQLGIDLDGIRSKKGLRALIKQHREG